LSGRPRWISPGASLIDAASDRFDDAERALDAGREERAQARQDWYSPRQEHERAAAAADRLQRRAAGLAGRLDRMAELTGSPGGVSPSRRRIAAGSQT
jgi:hypothetical protein